MKYWLVKSEPTTFSFDDLWALPKRTTRWDGVRNFQARNLLREMQVGDQVFFYHSSTDPTAARTLRSQWSRVIVGICEVVRAAYPDDTAFDAKDGHYDPKSRREAPTWYAVDIRAVQPCDRPVTLDELKAQKSLAGMVLLQRSRLSVQPVSAAEWQVIQRLAFK